MKLPTKPPPMTALIDTREITPWNLPGFEIEFTTLSTGDVSLRGMESIIAIERKGDVSDLLACVGRERERFERELMRLRAYPVRALICETDWATLERGDWRGKILPQQVIESLLSWQASGIPVVLAGSRQRAERIAASILRHAAKHQWLKLREFAKRIET